MKTTSSKNYEIRHFHSYIKKDNVDAFKKLIEKKPFLLNFKNFRNENILFYSLFCGSEKITNYLIHQKPQLLLERNNVGRNPIQSIANKQLELSFIIQSVLKNKLFDINNIISNVDNLGNNLLMYLSLYPELSHYNEIVNTVKNLDFSHQNKKGSNILHFLAANKSSLDKINLDLFDNQILTSKSKNLSNPLMFAAENQDLKSFVNLVNKYQLQLNKNDFESILKDKNSLDFNILDFAFLNKDENNTKYLIDNFSHLLDKNIKISNALIILKKILQNGNINSFVQFSEHYKIFDNINDKQELSNILQPLLNFNEKNSIFLDYLIEHKFELLSTLLFEDNINLERLNPKQWKYIFRQFEEKNNFPNLKKMGQLFPLMISNPKNQTQNIELYYSFIKKYNYKLENLITQSLLFLNESTVTSFLNNGFFTENKNIDSNALLYIFQNIYDLNDNINISDINFSCVTNEINIYKPLRSTIFTYINNLEKIIDNEDLLKSLFCLMDIEKNLTHQLIRTDKPFSLISKIGKVCNNEEKELFIKTSIYDIYYLNEKNIKIEYSSNEWEIFKKLYSETFLLKSNVGANENLEMIENFFGIFEANFSNQTIDNQLNFLDFISKHNYPIISSQWINSRFIQKTTDTITSNIMNNYDNNSKLYIKKLVDINSKLFEMNIPMNIPRAVLNILDKKDLLNYQKTKKSFFDKLFQNSTVEERHQSFNFLKSYYYTRVMDYLTLDEMIKEIPIERNRNLSMPESIKYMEFYYPEIIKDDLKEIVKVSLQKNIIDNLIHDYLQSNQLENIITLQDILINDTSIYSYKVQRFTETQIDKNKVNNLDYLNIYAYHCPNKLKDYDFLIKPYLDEIIKKPLSKIEVINTLNILDKMQIIEEYPDFIKKVIENNIDIDSYYNQFLEQFILKNKSSNVFDHINFNKIKNKVIVFQLEESFLERNTPIPKSTNKVIKF